MNMGKKVSAAAHPNLALVKYWGHRNTSLNLPANTSISLNLDGAKTETSVTFDAALEVDAISFNSKPAEVKVYQRMTRFLGLIREIAGIQTRACVVTENTFPESVGFASSSSGFAALALAGSKAAGLSLSDRQLSILARKGSGSACRSIPNGYVEWSAGDDDTSSFAFSIAPESHWNLAVISVIFSQVPKVVTSQQGHEAATSSPYFAARQASLPDTLTAVRDGIRLKDLTSLGMAVEREAISFHAIAMTSAPQQYPWMSGIYYWQPMTIHLLKAVQHWRHDGLPVYFTLDAGSTVHLLCEDAVLSDVRGGLLSLLKQLGVKADIVISHAGRGAWVIDNPDNEKTDGT